MMLYPSAARLACTLPFLFAFVAACAPDKSPGGDSATDGAALFAENCGDCHGEQGRGPSIADMRALTTDELRAAMKNHPTAGEIPQRLPAAEIQELIDYLED